MSLSPSISTRAFTPGDLAAVVALWNRCLPYDPITEEQFWRQFLLDVNFDPRGARVVHTADGIVVGFLQAITRRESYGSLGLQDKQGWIPTFFVHPEFRRQGIGSELLQEGLDFLRSQGRTQVSCNGYAPYYIFPGVDEAYAEALPFLTAHGFTVATNAVAMAMPLHDVQVPQAVRERRATLANDGFAIRHFQRADTLPLFAFAERHFPHWLPSLRDGLVHGNEDIVIATFGSEVVAFAQWQNPHNDPPNGAPGRFGPFGVHPDLRGRGIGARVFWATVAHAIETGADSLWFGWAGGQNVAFYERVGCYITRRYQIYARRL